MFDMDCRSEESFAMVNDDLTISSVTICMAVAKDTGSEDSFVILNPDGSESVMTSATAVVSTG